jgi:hypothetical protein
LSVEAREVARVSKTMKSKLNLPLVIGLSALIGGLVLAQYIAMAIYEALPAVEAPSTQTDNLFFALPFFIAKVLFQAAGPLLLVLIGYTLAVAGAVSAIVGLLQVIIRWFRRRRDGSPADPS